jgi:hypothetical protein
VQRLPYEAAVTDGALELAAGVGVAAALGLKVLVVLTGETDW